MLSLFTQLVVLLCSWRSSAVKISEDNLTAALANEDTFVKTLYTRWAGVSIAIVTSSLSAISSALIIFMILRSSSPLSSTYHRIMFGMSISDVFASTAMALSTSLLPKDAVYEQFEPKMLGNRTTCNLQGFLFTAGTNATFGYNAALCIYYLCAIKFKLKKVTMRKKCEPFLHMMSLCCGLIPSILFYFGDLFNPTPWDSWCTATLYPWYCGLKDVVDKESCMIIESNRQYASFGFAILFFGFFVGGGSVIGSMILITWSVYRQERLMKVYIERIYRVRAVSRDTRNHFASCRSRHHYTKVILYQALAYVFAFLLCQSNVIMSLLSARLDNARPLAVQYYHLLTRPLQGFFNLVVFVGHKVYNIFQLNKETRLLSAIYQAFTVKEEPTFIFTQISLVGRHRDGEDDISFDICEDVDIDDEDGHLYNQSIGEEEQSSVWYDDVEPRPKSQENDDFLSMSTNKTPKSTNLPSADVSWSRGGQGTSTTT